MVFFDCNTHLEKINYFYGGNGSGKTTISRVIANPENYQKCEVNWKNEQSLETLVYNRDFEDANYDEIKGIFTLGEESKETKRKIEILNEEIKKTQNRLVRYRDTLKGVDDTPGKEDELIDLNNEYIDIFWDIKIKYNKFREGFSGFNDNKKNFFKQILNESENKEAELLTEEELESKTNKVFSKEIKKAEIITVINFDELLSISNDDIWAKPIVGKKDIDFANLIQKLQNSDWVQKGKGYYESSVPKCPFCQQELTVEIEKSLEDYFDEAFLIDSKRVEELASTYLKEVSIIKKDLDRLVTLNSEFINNKQLMNKRELLVSIILINQKYIDEKQSELSRVIKFESMKDVSNDINNTISAANEKITENNRIFENLKDERVILTKQIWRFITDKLQVDIDRFKNKEKNLTEAIKGLSDGIKTQEGILRDKEEELKGLKKQSTSILPTCDNINNILNSFGFKSFQLDVIENTNFYRLIREDGCDAKETLSDGEKNFVSFLYFYHRIQGNQEESGISRSKIVVIDDPVSSLDSEVLFIISSLIKSLFDDIKKDSSDIKQIFVLTHNTYFHKEVSYDSKRGKDTTLKCETFWLVKKPGKYSIVEKKGSNPIKTTYDLLWEEIRSPNRNKATIQNTLRRIIESYFKLVGGMHLDETYEKANNENKIICRSLCSWMHDGSHNAFEDEHYSSYNDETVEKYLDVFKYIFKINGQIRHYNMMMGNEDEYEGEI